MGVRAMKPNQICVLGSYGSGDDERLVEPDDRRVEFWHVLLMMSAQPMISVSDGWGWVVTGRLRTRVAAEADAAALAYAYGLTRIKPVVDSEIVIADQAGPGRIGRDHRRILMSLPN